MQYHVFFLKSNSNAYGFVKKSNVYKINDNTTRTQQQINGKETVDGMVEDECTIDKVIIHRLENNLAGSL